MLLKCSYNYSGYCGSTSLGLGFVSFSRFCVTKIAPTCFANDFDVYMACVTLSAFFSIDCLEVIVILLACFEISYAAGKYLVDHKRSLESGESNAIGFVY